MNDTSTGLATNSHEAMRLDALHRSLRNAQESLGGNDRKHTIRSLQDARQQINETLARLEAAP